MICFSCKAETVDGSTYCGDCGSQLKCKNCNHIFTKKVNFCSSCGESLSINANSSEKLNRISFKETKNVRTFDAEFSDKLGSDMTSVLGEVVANKIINRNEIAGNGFSGESKIVDVEAKDITKNRELPVSSVLPTDSIFNTSTDDWSLIETRLKAKNVTDFGKRLVLLYVFLRGESDLPVTTQNVAKMLGNFNISNGSVNRYRGNKSVFTINDKYVLLTKKGKEDAKMLLDEVLDDGVENLFDIGNRGAVQTRSVKRRNYENLDLGLNEEKRKGLKAFVEEKSPQNQHDIIQVLAFWYTNKNGIDEFDLNVLYSLCILAGIKPPKDLGGIASKLKSKSRWISPSRGLFRVHSAGNDYVKLDLPKANVKSEN